MKDNKLRRVFSSEQQVEISSDSKPYTMMEFQSIRKMVAWLSVSENLIFALLTVIHIVPILVFDYFPSQDGPSHLYNSSIIRDYYRADASSYREYYLFRHVAGANWFGHLTLAGLLSLFSLPVASKIFLAGYVCLFLMAIRFAVRSISSDAAAVAFLAFPFVYNFPLHKGLYYFSYSVALFAVTLGYWIKHFPKFTFRHYAILTVLGILLYLTHIISLLMAIVAIAVLCLWFTRVDSVAARRAGLAQRRVLTAGWRGCLAFIPGVLGCGLFVYFQRDAGSKLDLESTLYWLKIMYWSASSHIIDLRDLIFFDLQSFQRAELAVYIPLIFGFIALSIFFLIRRFINPKISKGDGLLFLCALFFCLYLAVPDAFLEGSGIRRRMTLYPVILAMMWFASQHFNVFAKRLLICGASVLSILLLVIFSGKYAEYNNYLREFLSGKNLIETNTTILPISLTAKARNDGSPYLYLHAAGYLAAEKHAVNLANYQANTPHFPVQFRPNLNPYVYIGNAEDAKHLDLDIVNYHRKTGGQIDYIIIWSETNAGKDLQKFTLARQLQEAYALIHVSPQGLMQLFRRKNWEQKS